MSKDLRGAFIASGLVSLLLIISYALASHSVGMGYDQPWKWFGALSVLSFLGACGAVVMVLTAIERLLDLD